MYKRPHHSSDSEKDQNRITKPCRSQNSHLLLLKNWQASNLCELQTCNADNQWPKAIIMQLSKHYAQESALIEHQTVLTYLLGEHAHKSNTFNHPRVDDLTTSR